LTSTCNPSISLLPLSVTSLIPLEAKKIAIEVYDCQDSDSVQYEDGGGGGDDTLLDQSDLETDEDKILYTMIGKTEIPIDKVLTNLLTNEVR
jgi:hypothetical protein